MQSPAPGPLLQGARRPPVGTRFAAVRVTGRRLLGCLLRAVPGIQGSRGHLPLFTHEQVFYRFQRRLGVSQVSGCHCSFLSATTFENLQLYLRDHYAS